MSRNSKHAPSSASTPVGSALRNRPPQNYRTKPVSSRNPKKTRLIPSFRGEPIPAPATLRRDPSQLRHRGRNSPALVPVRRRPSGAIPDKTPTEAIFEPQLKENRPHTPFAKRTHFTPETATARSLATAALRPEFIAICPCPEPSLWSHPRQNTNRSHFQTTTQRKQAHTLYARRTHSRPENAAPLPLTTPALGRKFLGTCPCPAPTLWSHPRQNTNRSHFRTTTQRKQAHTLYARRTHSVPKTLRRFPQPPQPASGIPRHMSLFGTSPSGAVRQRITERSHFRPRTRRKHASYPLFEANPFPPRQRSAALPRNCGTAAGIPRHLSLSGADPLEPSATKHQPKPFSNHNPKKTSTYPLCETNPLNPAQGARHRSESRRVQAARVSSQKSSNL
jgi:hypothetical protein